MSKTTCPYDGDWCRKKQESVNNNGICLQTGAPVAKLTSGDCPFATAKERHIECQRYRRYEWIIQNFDNFLK